MKTNSATIGFRVKSGWAAAVLLGGSARSPEILGSCAIDLSDPSVSESRQPYHARTGMLEQDKSKIKRRTEIVRRAAEQSVSELLGQYSHYGISAAALVVGSQIDPASIGNPHIRAHALEGQLFRTVLQEALRLQRVRSVTLLERELWAQAESALERSEMELKRVLADRKASVQGPWRADEKMAALAAWILLAER